MTTNGRPTISDIMQDTPRIEKALRDAIQETLRTHKLLGQPVVAWRDGKVVWIPAEAIELLPDDNGYGVRS
jgi:hypothetical protein